MATRAEVARTDNSKLGREVLNRREGAGGPGPSKGQPIPFPRVDKPVPPVRKKTKTTKTTKKKKD